MANSKPWYMSKTVLVNLLTAVATIGADVSGVLPPEWSPKILGAVAIVNILLRFVTSLPIAVLVTSFVWMSGSVLAAEPPVFSSVRMVNGTVYQCSGTVFSKGDSFAVAIGAAHCFSGNIGAEFDIRIAGKPAKATLIAHDPEKDLALWKLPASAVVEVAEFPGEQPEGPMTAIGFPQGATTEQVKKLKYRDQFDQGGRYQWRCEVLEGRFEGGDSGGGVFMDGRLAAVIHGKESKQVCENGTCRVVNYLHAVCYRDVRKFVDSHKDKWSDCVGGKCVPPPPPEDKAPPVNDMAKSDKLMATEVDKLRKRIDELSQQCETLKQLVEAQKNGSLAVPGPAGPVGAQGIPGERGLTGKDGRDGSDGQPGRDGVAGPSGTITVVLIDDQGREVTRASNVASGSVAKLNIKRILKGE